MNEAPQSIPTPSPTITPAPDPAPTAKPPQSLVVLKWATAILMVVLVCAAAFVATIIALSGPDNMGMAGFALVILILGALPIIAGVALLSLVLLGVYAFANKQANTEQASKRSVPLGLIIGGVITLWILGIAGFILAQWYLP